MDDLIDGTIEGWPVSLMYMEAWQGSGIYGGHCAPYTDAEDNSAPEHLNIQERCHAITDATDGMSRRRSILAKAKTMGFVPD